MKIHTKITLVICFALVCCLLAWHYLLPGYVQSIVQKKIADNKLPPIDLSISNISLNNFTATDISLGPKDNPAIRLDSIDISYSLGGLLNKQINAITTSGLRITVISDGKNIHIPGFGELGKPQSSSTKKSTNQQLPFDLIPKVAINNATILYTDSNANQSFSLPFSLLFEPDQKKKSAAISGQLHPFSQQVTLQGSVDYQTADLAIQGSNNNFPLAFLKEIIAVPELVRLGGSVDFNGKADVGLDPLSVKSMNVDLDLSKAVIAHNKFVVKQRDSSQQTVSLHGNSAKLFAKIHSLSFSGPVQGNTGLWAEYDIDTGLGSGKLSINLELDEQQRDKIKLTQLPPLHFVTDFSFDKELRWSFEGTNSLGESEAQMNDILLSVKDYTFSVSQPIIEITGQGNRSSGKTDYAIGLTVNSVLSPKDPNNNTLPMFTVPELQMTGSLAFNNQQELPVLTNTLSVQANQVKISTPQISFSGDFSLETDSSFKDKFSNSLAGQFSLKNGQATINNQRTDMNSIDLSLPFAWPPNSSKPPTGNLTIGSITHQGVNFGPVSSKISQSGKTIFMDAIHTSDIFSGVTIRSSGSAGLTDKGVFAFEFDAKSESMLSQIDLQPFMPNGQSLFFEGAINLQANASLHDNKLRSKVHASLQNSHISYPANDVTVQGISLDFSIPDLSVMRSAPAKIAFEQAQLGEIKLANGSIDFTLESPKSILIEKTNVGWCDGAIDTHAFRINPDKKDYSLTLFCSRLHLAQVLEQLGIMQKISGGGTVSGKIPVALHSGEITFTNGFLYSSPGSSGYIKLTGGEMLTAGLPKNSAQFSQLDFVASALNDFKYDWAKLYLTSKGEDATLSMELSGKPAKPLPFKYNPKIGNFTRLAVGSPGGIFQPIQLDANFHLPLNRILGFGSSINDILQ